MITALEHTWYMCVRLLRNLSRQPAWIVVSLIQPLIYLLIFAPAFKSVVQIPGSAAVLTSTTSCRASSS